MAVCEQLEDPAEARKRGAKAVVKRDVVRLVTPGTLTEENAARRAGESSSFMAIGHIGPGVQGAPNTRLAWIDISTGQFRMMRRRRPKGCESDITRIGPPSEIAISDSAYDRATTCVRCWT